jgi:hypothetical protein
VRLDHSLTEGDGAIPIREIGAGGNGEGVTPVPIPNTVVKPFSADGTARETAWESRSPPPPPPSSGRPPGPSRFGGFFALADFLATGGQGGIGLGRWLPVRNAGWKELPPLLRHGLLILLSAEPHERPKVSPRLVPRFLRTWRGRTGMRLSQRVSLIDGVIRRELYGRGVEPCY